MNPKLKIASSSWQNFFARSSLVAVLLAVTALPGQNSWAADILWDGSPTGNGSAWTTAANWAGDVVPTSADNAIFGSSNAVTLYTVNNASQQVGCIIAGADRPNTFSIRSLSSASGTLVLNGVGGILLSNGSPTATMTFTNSSAGATYLTLNLAASGSIYAGSGGTIQSYSAINETGGSRSITKIGPGILYLRSTNNYSGDTTVSAGDLEVDDVGTIGNGAGTLYLSGGNLLSGASRNGQSSAAPPIANPIVLTQDAYIQNKAGTATTRFLALSGSLGGSAGTLKIADPTTVPGNTFAVRLFGSFTFNRPMIVGEAGYDLASAFSVLELGNTNGTQTFNGNISGVGSIRRLNPFSSGSPAGPSIFTGSNSYSGGTLISGGTLFANNSTGSALGSGAVTVTNKGILGGNGAVVASTALNLDGTISPGLATNGIANLGISDLTFNPGGNYVWQISAATGVAGTAWDLITCSSGWTDAGISASNLITIKVDSLGAVPTGWASGTARDWVIIQSSSATGFDDSHFTIDTTSFTGTVAGIFNLTNVSGALHLRYTPASDVIINVASGSQTQGGVSPTPYPLLTGAVGVIKVGNGEVVLTNSSNDYQGSTKIHAGTASAAVDALNSSPSAFGDSSSALLLGNTLGNSNATLNISVAGVTIARSVVVQSGSSGAKTIGTTITSGAATYSGDVALQDSATLSVAAGGSASYSGNFTGAGGLTFGGGGTITMSALNSYTGPSALTGGTLNLNAKALGTNTFTISAASTLDNTGASSVTLNDCPQNWNANFTFTGTTNLNLGGGPVTMSATRTLTINNSTLTVGGAISGSAGLVKLGAGTLALAGATSSTYTGGTTNTAGVLALNGTATLGDATSPLVLNGGDILSTGTRSGLPVSNSVVMMTSATIYGNSTASAPSTRILPFSGSWTVSSGTLRIGNTGSSNNTFTARFTAGSDVNYPVIVGDPGFDTPGAICEFQLYNDNTTPVQTVSGLISGNGQVWRGHLTSGAGGTSVFTGNNTFSGGTVLDSGTLGIGLNSTPTSGVVTSGPLGTGTFEIDNDPSIYIYASGGARTIGNHVYLNGVTNTVLTGTNALTFTGDVDLGGVTKTLTVSNTALTTFTGVMTNSAALIKAGPGKLVFTGDNVSRTNITTVNNGTLILNNTSGSGTGSGAVIVNSPGVLGGSGIIAGAVTASGDISPGQSAGALTLGDGLDLNSGGTYVWELAANSTNNPGTNFDILPVTGGNLFLGGVSKLSVNFTGSATIPDAGNPFWQSTRQWTIIALSGGATNIGPTVFPTIINGTNAAGYFTNFADVTGSIVLQFIPSAVAPTPPPQPVISPVIAGANTASATISWSATNGYTYTVQYKTNLTQPTWDTLGTSTATGSTASFNDTTGPRKQTFYRVIWP